MEKTNSTFTASEVGRLLSVPMSQIAQAADRLTCGHKTGEHRNSPVLFSGDEVIRIAGHLGIEIKDAEPLTELVDRLTAQKSELKAQVSQLEATLAARMVTACGQAEAFIDRLEKIGGLVACPAAGPGGPNGSVASYRRLSAIAADLKKQLPPASATAGQRKVFLDRTAPIFAEANAIVEELLGGKEPDA